MTLAQASLKDIQTNPTDIIHQVVDNHCPVMLMDAGRGLAVVQALSDYERTETDLAFMRAIIEGLLDVESGREVSLAEAKERLGMI
jgi:prevent-host-death family protein